MRSREAEGEERVVSWNINEREFLRERSGEWHGFTSDSSCSFRQLSRNRSDRSTDFLALFMEVASSQVASPSERHWNQSG